MRSDRPEDQVAILGAGGHVGLPLSVVLADAGYSVTGIDQNADINRRLMAGEVPYVEHGCAELLSRALSQGTLTFTTDTAAMASAATLVVIIGTPIDDNLNPRVDALLSIVSSHAASMPRGQLIVLRSTVSPGTTALLRTILEERSGLTEGVDFHLVFAPERVLQTRAVHEIKSLPQLVGAFCDASFHRAEAFFSRFLDNRCIRLAPVEAELGKLITNMARYVNFAMANEFYMICDTYGANAHRVIASCNQDYPRLDLPRPGPNVGGPCLYKDGYYLTEHIAYPELIANAFKINESVTRFLLSKATAHGRLRRAGILGLAFKADCDDTRNSLSFKLIKQLRGIHCDTVEVDPYVEGKRDFARLAGVDALFLMTPHREFRDLAAILAHVANPDCLVLDMWNFWSEHADLSHNGVYTARQALAAAAGTTP